MANKPIIQLDDLMMDHFLKEDIEEELRSMFLETSGEKENLIFIFLKSKWAQGQTVSSLSKYLLGKMSKEDLVIFCKTLRIEVSGKKDELIERVIESVQFEPYLQFVWHKKCDVCSQTDRAHLIHFDDDWKPKYIECSLCKKISPIGSAFSIKTESEISKTAPTIKPKVQESMEIVRSLIEKQYPDDLTHILNEINNCLRCNALTAASIMIRKTIESAIFLRFARDRKEDQILTSSGDTLSFENKIDKAIQNGFLSVSRGKELKKVKWFGDSGAHSIRVRIDEDDINITLNLTKICLQEISP